MSEPIPPRPDHIPSHNPKRQNPKPWMSWALVAMLLIPFIAIVLLIGILRFFGHHRWWPG